MKSTLVMMLLLSSCVALAEQYYQADPAKLAQLEAQRCAKLQKENNLINQRLSGNNKPYDIAKMKDRQKVLQADYAKFCTK
ncbi:hypothetical protein HQ393_09725 [Chitinibacter bivalviorum]|uniref:DUF1090 family protein n=1 Tax=Chitinibacter bivalviorum TaxID=2739434 RepID=A0A7H9BMA7_9NEIS|nr:hypothetical protein [Chitinibacter bivalviorum]QLG88504.1 hypothetical protein HQ393_09725 [Chitinibacter bivalviorum]